ncbi:MAG: spore maturation protein [Chitinophagaceae bacterium]|jgi:spore maturation protein SpmA/spore maturation protein SpmB|nr:spore maturation protein [Chitinophagaceae bacterium]MBK7679470.1 spore maturation protein [Chitinophagaceae bacterium]MBK8299181.1 spore maturation protein [Chitinophagaceae bacterium]MBK9463233.1 spore maturation protein [Chitinophagaceae bacterium]MBK9659638.1 spore maturation protein [Chitinophagaceae bacterium]
MALSRIWTAFIIIALLVAAGRFVFQPGQQNLFGSLVTGKNSDTVAVRTVDSAAIPATVLSQFSNQKVAVWGKEKIYKTEGTTYRAYRLLPANGIFETTKDAVNLCIGLIGIMALFMGFMSIAERAGGIRFLSRIIGPFFSKIFPEVPKNHPSMGHMVMNFSANLMGLDNAATPFGIKAMESLQEINPDKDRASNAQLMFLCLHASGLTLIPTIIIADRVALKSAHPTDIFIPCMIATFVATIAAMLIVAFRQRIRIFQPVILFWVLGISTVIAALIYYIKSLDAQGVQLFSTSLSNGIILLIFLLIVLGGMYKKINIFDAFIDGAKGGFETAVRIIPYLVGLLVAISLLRNSGAFEFVLDGIKNLFVLLNGDTRIVDSLPTALIKPLSGSGARAIMIDTMNAHGPDSFAGNLASVFRGSSDTTFYIIAVYFGAVGIKNTRYAVTTMLLADLAGIITAIAMAYIFFA